ncbi:Uncharacterized protein, contains FMN-binding domain [Anaerobranca californiensis DSM 14826]|jgi:uncharacterized protein with FMN-binding domain|uniref:Uncharacterized protein, contains FMN-binding domain n=1 Tax=Anaerobranca californiensis DSM 14826 TaxID=1120989 RepID=A0A1M6KAH5_9FIRM|nr:FMN-binding protein [Anaerobranca californiensis]SHJ55932.1 Uncharacterized protein, contains FMN-binding domain [Anaerobranca californiensis DSM 14826]
MKKLLVLMLISLMALTIFAGCSSKTEEQPKDEPNYVYKNGTFVGYSDNNRGYVKAEVTIEKDQIKSVKLTEYQGNAIEKDPETYGREGAFEIGLLAQVHEYLENAFVEANGTNIDAFSGATSTSNKAKQAVDRALLKAKVDATPGLIDGTYLGRSEITEKGYSVAEIKIEGGKIVEVNLYDMRAVENGFEQKPEDYQWEAYHEAREAVAAAMLEANSYDVETYTGATSSSEKWIQIVKELLERATIK